MVPAYFNMYIAIIAAFVVVTSIPSFAEETSIDHADEILAESILDELEDNNDEGGDIRSAVRYMIPVPVRRVIVQVPRQAAPPQPPPERDPIVAVPIAVSPGPYPSWRPIGPPVLAVPIGSPSPYPDDDYDNDFERRALSSELRKPGKTGKGNEHNRHQAGFKAAHTAHSSPRRTRSINEKNLKIKTEDVFRRDLTLGSIQDSVPTKGIRGVDIPYKVSAKSWRRASGGHKRAAGHVRRKRQQYSYGNSNYVVRGRYNRPSPMIVPTAPGHVLVPVPVSTQVVPVPVYVPVAVDP